MRELNISWPKLNKLSHKKIMYWIIQPLAWLNAIYSFQNLMFWATWTAVNDGNPLPLWFKVSAIYSGGFLIPLVIAAVGTHEEKWKHQ